MHIDIQADIDSDKHTQTIMQHKQQQEHVCVYASMHCAHSKCFCKSIEHNTRVHIPSISKKASVDFCDLDAAREQEERNSSSSSSS